TGKALVERDFREAADRDRYPVMQLSRRDVEDAGPSRRRASSGLLDDESERVALVEDADLAGGLPRRRVRRIEVDAPFQEDAVRVSTQRAGVARGLGTAGRLVPALEVVDERAVGFRPARPPPFVD